MARTAAEVEAELDKLKALRATGVTQSTFGDQSTRLAEGDDLERRIAALERELATLQTTRRTHRLAVVRKGF